MVCKACNQPIDANHAYVVIPVSWTEPEHTIHLSCWRTPGRITEQSSALRTGSRSDGWHDHVCVRCWDIFTDSNWNCAIQPHEALCAQCTRDDALKQTPKLP